MREWNAAIWVSVIGAVVSGVSMLIAGAAFLNTRVSRFDSYNLDLFKLQIDAGAVLITTVDTASTAASKSLDDITALNAIIENRIRADGNNAQPVLLADLAYKQRTEQLGNDIAESQKVMEFLQKQINAFLLVVPLPVAKSLVSALPHRQTPQDAAARWGRPVLQVMTASANHDAAGLSQALQGIQKVNDELSSMRQRYQAEDQKWETGKAHFACAVQVARMQHTAPNEIPKGCE